MDKTFKDYLPIEQDLILNNIFALYVFFIPVCYGIIAFNLLFKMKRSEGNG